MSEVYKWFTVKRSRPQGHPWWKPRPRERVTALERVSFTVGNGETAGLLGSNGAGKSTLVKLLTGLLIPDSGTVSILDKDPHRNARSCARHLGVVFGQRSQLWWDLPGRASFDILKAIYEIPDADFATRMRRLNSTLDLYAFWETPVRSMSLGQRVRADLAAALLHHPAVLFLDEPTIGLDVLVKDQVRTLLAELAGTGDHTIVLTSHDATDIETLCPRLIVVDSGNLIYDGASQDIARLIGSTDRLVSVEFSKPTPHSGELHYGTTISHSATAATFSAKPGCSERDLAAELLTRFPVASISFGKTRLDNVLRSLYAGNISRASQPVAP